MKLLIEIDDEIIGPVQDYAKAQGMTFDQLVNITLANEFLGNKVEEPVDDEEITNYN